MAIPCETERPMVSDHMLAIGIYLLYVAGYFFVIPALMGVVIAHVKLDDDDIDPVLRSHYQFQIGNFWIGLLYIAIGIPLSMVLIGIAVLAWWFVWSLIRIIKGIIAVNEYKPVANPGSWLFG